MNTLSAHDIKNLLRQGKDKYIIVREDIYQGKLYIAEKGNPSIIIGRVMKSVLSGFNTQVCSVPLQYYEFMDTETFKHQRD